jgi:glycosyltransferase involved in cell wall biosynthesis
MINFTLAIPLYNEEKNLDNLFRALLKSHLIHDKTCKYIIFINDGSFDRTFFLLKKNIHRSKKFIHLNHKNNNCFQLNSSCHLLLVHVKINQ